jgi:4-amino-4-deoxy-L-arabinose transferase-like glycosyltransferase
MKKNVIFLGIIFIAIIFRFSALGKIPVSLYWDEAAVGYNAYSVLLTGRDEYGNLLPLLFRSFEDYKMPAYVYLTAVPIGFFGLNEFSVRFVSAFAGVIAVLLTYFLIRILFIQFFNLKKNILGEKNNAIAFLSSFLLAISPWHLQFSRTGFEANVALTTSLAGFYFFFRSFLNQKYFPFAFFFFTLSFYLYRSIFIFLPIFLIGLLIFFRQELFSSERRIKTTMTLIVFIICIAPITYAVFVGPGRVRADQVSVFRHSQEALLENLQKQQQEGNTFISRVLYNRRITYARITIQNYLSHFSPAFLFFSGDGNGRHTVKNMGVLYRWEMPFLLLGFFLILREKSKLRLILLLWIFAAPLAASLSTPSPHALRALNMLPIPQILTASGIIFVFFKLQRIYRIAFFFIMTLVVSISFNEYWKEYNYHNTVTASADWADGYKQLVSEVQKREKNYDRVLISGYYWQPYIYFLFYTRYDPYLFQQSGKKEGFGKYVFGGTEWDKDRGRGELHDVDLVELTGSKNILVALSPSEYQAHSNELQKITEIRNAKNDSIFILGSMRK